MTWASILAGLAKLAGLVMTFINNRQLLDAGRAIERDRLSTEERARVDAANRARLSAGDDGVFVDPFDAANGRSVPDVPTDRLRQPGDPA
jgi:hypothetical protein